MLDLQKKYITPLRIELHNFEIDTVMNIIHKNSYVVVGYLCNVSSYVRLTEEIHKTTLYFIFPKYYHENTN